MRKCVSPAGYTLMRFAALAAYGGENPIAATITATATGNTASVKGGSTSFLLAVTLVACSQSCPS